MRTKWSSLPSVCPLQHDLPNEHLFQGFLIQLFFNVHIKSKLL